MKRSIIALAVATLLAGCASLENAGHAAYTMTAVKDKDGKVSGYELTVKDGKEFAGRRVQFHAGTGTLVLDEGESRAFRGQAIGAKALSVMPVTGLGDLLKAAP